MPVKYKITTNLITVQNCSFVLTLSRAYHVTLSFPFPLRRAVV